jgi:hypothetical protein
MPKDFLMTKSSTQTYGQKIRFPELFDVSPAQSAEREASEAEAARDEANTLREITEKEGSKDIIIQSQTQPTIEEKEELAGWYFMEANLGLFANIYY